MKTGLITSETYQDHDTGPGHPEQIARVTVINEYLRKVNNKNILWKKPSIITDDIINLMQQDQLLRLLMVYKIKYLKMLFVMFVLQVITATKIKRQDFVF